MAATLTPTLPMDCADDQRWIVRWLPSLTDFAFLIPVVLLVWLLPGGLSTLLGDGDTGWHIRTGEWILAHHTIPHTDIFSFTRFGEPWFAWEWGWDVLFALVHSFTGLAGLVFVNLLLLCFVAALLFRSVRAMCSNDLLAFAVTTVGLGASVIHWLARPHLLSWLLFLVLLRVLRNAENGDIKQLWCLPVLLLFWTNVHGSFFLGVFMIALSALAQCLPSQSGLGSFWMGAWRRSRPFWLCAVVCGAVTFVNPYTWHVHAHIWQYIHDSALLDSIQEFQSTSFHHGPSVFFGWLLLPAGGAILWCCQKRYWSGCFAVIAWMHFSLLAARNIPMFVFVVCPFIAVMLQEVFTNQLQPIWPQAGPFFATVQSQLFPFERMPRCYALSAVACLCVGLCLAAKLPGFDVNFPSKRFPEAALPSIAKLHATRIFTTDQWGDYLTYKLYPSSRVFVDGRSDFYGASFLERCGHILSARWDWENDLNRFSVDMVVVTPDTPIATVLKRSSRWRVVFDNKSLIVFGLQPRVAGPILRGA